MKKEHFPKIEIKTIHDVSEEEKSAIAGEIVSSVRKEDFDEKFDQLVVSSIEIPSTGFIDEQVRD